jgi:hypothetical protein
MIDDTILAASANEHLMLATYADGSVLIRAYGEVKLPQEQIARLLEALHFLRPMSRPEGDDLRRYAPNALLTVCLDEYADITIAYGADADPAQTVIVPAVQFTRLVRTLEGMV